MSGIENIWKPEMMPNKRMNMANLMGLGVVLGVVCIILFMYCQTYKEHARNRSRNVYGAKAGNVQYVAPCTNCGSSISKANTNLVNRRVRG